VDNRSARNDRLWRLVNLAAFAGVVVIVLSIALQPWINDAHAYWSAWQDGQLYELPWLANQAYVYSPASAQIIWPLTLLPFPAFHALIVVVQAACLIVLARPILAFALLVAPILVVPGGQNFVVYTLSTGNIMLPLGAVAAYGFRWPGLWAITLLTKVTPAVGLLWFAVRREWRPLAIALGLTAAISAMSFVLDPGLWFGWLAFLATAARADGAGREVFPTLPLGIRLVMAVLVVVWGARTNRPWTVPIAAMLGVPSIMPNGLTIGLGALPLLRHSFVSEKTELSPMTPLSPKVVEATVTPLIST
jgi:hypothetical protein